MLMKLTSGVNYTNQSFYIRTQIPEAIKDSQVISDFLHFWDLRA